MGGMRTARKNSPLAGLPVAEGANCPGENRGGLPLRAPRCPGHAGHVPCNYCRGGGAVPPAVRVTAKHLPRYGGRGPLDGC